MQTEPTPVSSQTNIFAVLARRLFASDRPDEIATATANAAETLIGWDGFHLLYSKDEAAGLRTLFALERQPGGELKRVEQPDPVDPERALADAREAGAQLITITRKTDKLPPGTLGSQSHRPLAVLIAPIGRTSRNAGQIILQRDGNKPYESQDLTLLLALANYCGDALVRAQRESEPHAPKDVVEERNLLRTLVDSIPDYLYIKDLDSRFVLSNTALARSFGRDTEREVIGKRDADFAPPELEAQYRSDEVAVITTGQPLVDHEELVVEASGKRVWVSTTKIPLRDERGRVIGLVGVGHNPHPVEKREEYRHGTAEDTAREAGVSVATVSRAFNGSPRVTEETRQRIYQVAKQVGYHPNAAARSLSKGRTEVLAVMLFGNSLGKQFYAEMVSGLQSASRKAGFDVLIYNAEDEDHVLGQIDEIVSGRKAGALAVQADSFSAETLNSLSNLPLPLVLLNHVPDSTETSGIISIGFDNRFGTRQAVRHLVALGHQHIALFSRAAYNQEDALREEGFRAGLLECGIAIQDNCFFRCEAHPGQPIGTVEIQELLSRNKYPTAVVCSTDAIAAGVITGARDWGHKIPQDLSVTGFGDETWTQVVNPPVTTVVQRGRDLGTAAGQILVAHTKGEPRSVENMLLPTRLIVRGSTAPPSKA